MTWRGSTDWQQRIISVLIYILPLMQVSVFGGTSGLFSTFPWLEIIYIPFIPVISLYNLLGLGNIPFFSLILFFGLYLGVVRNEKLAHFLRFNTMQALLLLIFTILCSYVLRILGTLGNTLPLTPDLLPSVLGSLIFISVTGACLFSMVQVARGLYAEYPFISEAAYAQTR